MRDILYLLAFEISTALALAGVVNSFLGGRPSGRPSSNGGKA
jgi:hypothetical protein